MVQQPSVKDIGPIYWYRGEHMITPFDADDGPEPVVPPRSRDRTLDGPEDLSPNDIMSEVDLQKEFATRIAMESQLGDTLKSRWVILVAPEGRRSLIEMFSSALPASHNPPQAPHLECPDHGHRQLHVSANDGQQRQCSGSCD